MKRVADTSFLYAAFDAADARHERARNEIARPHALGIPLCVLAEFLDLVEYRHGRATAARVQRGLSSFPTVVLTAVQDEKGVLDLWSHHPALSVADAAGVKACLEADAVLLSYDEDQHAALAGLRVQCGPVQDPAEE